MKKEPLQIWHTTSHLFIPILQDILIKSLEKLELKCYPEHTLFF